MRALGWVNRLLSTAALEARLNLLSPGPWVTGAILALLGYLGARTSPDTSSFPVVWGLWEELSPLAAVLVMFLAASLANRAVRYDFTELQDSKPGSGAELMLGRWLGALPAILVALGMEFGAAMAAQALHTRHPLRWEVYGAGLRLCLPSTLFLATLAFVLVHTGRHLIAGAGIAGLLWAVLHLGREMMPTSLALNLSQNAVTWLGATAACLLFAAYGSVRRAARVTRLAARLTVALAWCCSLAVAIRATWQEQALPSRTRTVRAAGRHEPGRPPRDRPLPAFSWVDQRQRRFSLARMREKPTLLVFHQPRDSGLLTLLRRLSALHDEFSGDGLQVTSVFLSEDLGCVREIQRLQPTRFPMTVDWGKPGPEKFDPKRPGSVAAWKLDVHRTPYALLLNAEGRESRRDLPLDEASADDLRLRLREALKS